MGNQLSIEILPRLTRLICAEEGEFTIQSRGLRDGGLMSSWSGSYEREGAGNFQKMASEI